MDRLCMEDLERLAKLESPIRNRYFYGKLLTERHFELEQRYVNRKQWLLNRLTLGSGVVCGLDLKRVGNDKMVLTPGVAIDGFGREIIVPELSRAFDPAALTDECGQPTGHRASGAVTICLAYHECEIEPVPVRVTECETDERCAPSLVLERYMVLVLGADEKHFPIACRDPKLFEGSAEDIHHELVARALRDDCVAPGRACVPLARVDGGKIVRDVRRLVYPGPLLYELILCLSRRVEACCNELTLRYVSGDLQKGPPDDVLKDDLVVEVLDGEGTPVADEDVIFRVQGGGGTMVASGAIETRVRSAADGRAAAKWKLGKATPMQTATASIAGGASIVFHAFVEAATAKPPIIKSVWPGNGLSIKPGNNADYDRWRKPHIELVFDQAMKAQQLAAPQNWLGLYKVRQVTGPPNPSVEVTRLPLSLEVTTPTVVYRPNVGSVGATHNAYYVIVARADPAHPFIESAAGPGMSLDADFAGTALTQAHLDNLWLYKPGDTRTDSASLIPLLTSSGAVLPSGDGTPGGWFHSVFHIGD